MEFKGEEKEPFNDRDLVEAAVCLANRHGVGLALLIVGVEDDGRLTGARPRHGNRTDPARVSALIANQTNPSLSCHAELVQLDESELLVVSVPVSRVPVGTSRGAYFRRALGGRGEPVCLPMSYADMLSLQSGRGLHDITESVVADAVWDDLDPLEIERYRRTIRESRGRGDASLIGLSDLDLAKAVGAVDGTHAAEHVRLLGLLLFGREAALREHVPTHEVAFQVLSGLEVRVNDIFRWPLLRVMDECLSRHRSRNEEQEVRVGMIRVGVPDYPEAAFREALANALIHRDFSRRGAVHVQWHDDRIEFSNPGGLPEGVSVANILVAPPRPRNPSLADAFKRAGLVERTARGVDTIFYEQLRTGRPPPSYERTSPTDVVLLLPGGEANLAFVSFVAEQENAGRTLGVNDLLVLNRLQLDRTVTSAEAGTLTQQPLSEARRTLERLFEAGLLERRGVGKARSYLLSAAVYRRLGEQAAYVRQRGFEPLQQEQMVISYVKAHDEITRQAAAELCGLTGPQAYRLLRGLVERGILIQTTPRGRGVRYRRATTA